LQPGVPARRAGLRALCDRAGGGRGGGGPGHRAELLQQPHDRGRGYGRGAERLIMSLTEFHKYPGLYFVWATFLPLASFAFLLLASPVRSFTRRYHEAPGEYVTPPAWPAYVATGAIAGAFVLSLIGAIVFFQEQGVGQHAHHEKSAEAKTEEPKE